MAGLLDFVEFNQYKWGNFGQESGKKRQKGRTAGFGFTNKTFDENKETINKKMEITLKVNGDYKNLLYFIYQYENISDLLRIEKISINKTPITT